MNDINNEVRLCGTLGSRPEYSHSSRGEDFYQFPLCAARLSGTVDTVNVIARRELLEGLEIEQSGKIAVTGELRSFNNRSGQGRRLIISVFARQILFCDGEDENFVALYGTLCKPPVYRKTPMGRRICDMMLAVNRKYGRSDYLPCIAWGRCAETTAFLTVGDKLGLEGRIQSRSYIKNEDGTPVERTAFEVSVLSITQPPELICP